MNRIVLVGNGFDLSLGMKTGYKDFICWLLKKGMSNSLNSGKKYIGRDRVSGYFESRLFNIYLPNQLYNIKYNDYVKGLNNFHLIKNCFDQERPYFELKIKSDFFSQIYNHIGDMGWVDIEGLYFNSLKKICKNNLNAIDELNTDIENITDLLEEYLSEVNETVVDIRPIVSNHLNNFTKPVQKGELFEVINEDEIKVKSIYFLNFNYTNFLYRVTKDMESYRHNRGNYSIERNPIHGQINSKENPIIFGFGDEVDEEYKFIENLNDNRFLSHIKSFKYLNTLNYSHLMRFIDSDSYQVYIYGHSCGLSDRIMLKEIFENENCKSIKIFYHQRGDGNDDFMEKTQDISRHFDNKGLMRRKIVPKDLCQALQQNNIR